ncbi:MAG: CCA tRNA nucleotidyltransferase [Microbacteriaceae bacterium]|nr:CCA tRNA nucleotidyltransferase [Microbacteriaceae bacterium]
MLPIAKGMVQLQQIADTEPVKTLAAAFDKAGFEFALVGGPVRDALLGRPVTDLDFTTNARPEQTSEVLQSISKKTWDIGQAFGTIAARVAGQTVEVTTYRAEVYHSDSRKPEVSFGDTIEGDLVRRDFTVNALALMLPQMRLVDVAGGLEHLLGGVLDTPGAPEVSFSDDPLRMLRAARFAGQLGFSVAPRVIAAMAEMAPRLEIISRERVRDELVKLINSSRPVPGLRLLAETGLMAQFLPEFDALRNTQDDQNRHKDVYEHSLTVLEQAIDLELARRAPEVTEPDTVLRIAALLHDIGKPPTRRFEKGAVTFYAHDVVGAKMARKRLRELKFDNDSVKRIAKLVELHMRFFGYTDAEWTDSAVRRYVRDAGDQLEQLHIITRADVTTKNEKKAARLRRAYDGLEERIAQLAAEEELAAVRPELDGEQIMQILQIGPGREVGAAYKFLLNIRLDEGPIGPEAATRRLLDWWAEQGK